MRINIPLNLHSCVVEILHNKGRDELEIKAYWRASDNSQTGPLDFFRTLALFMGIPLTSANIRGGDLEVVFASQDEKQFDLLSRAISQINSSTINRSNHYLKKLSYLIYTSNATEKNPISEQKIARENIEKEIIKYLRKYFFKNAIIPEVAEKVLNELAGKSPPDPYFKGARIPVLKSLAFEKREEVAWENLMGVQTLTIKEIGVSLDQLDILIRLFKEQPEKSNAFWEKYPNHKNEFDRLLRMEEL